MGWEETVIPDVRQWASELLKEQAEITWHSRDAEVEELTRKGEELCQKYGELLITSHSKVEELKAKIVKQKAAMDALAEAFKLAKQEGRREVVEWLKSHSIFEEHGAEITESGIQPVTKPVYLTEELQSQLKVWGVEE